MLGANLATEVLFASTLGIVLAAFGTSLPLATLLVVNVSVALFAGIMPVPGGIGVTEGALVVMLTAAGVDEATAFGAAIAGLSENRLVLLLLVNLIFFVAGMFLDSTTATLLIVPIIAPPVVEAGVDPVHLGLIVVFNLMIGLLTPPMGLALFLICDIAQISMKALLRALVPFYAPLAATLAAITLWEDMVLAIPRLIR